MKLSRAAEIAKNLKKKPKKIEDSKSPPEVPEVSDPKLGIEPEDKIHKTKKEFTDDEKRKVKKRRRVEESREDTRNEKLRGKGNGRKVSKGSRGESRPSPIPPRSKKQKKQL